MSEYQYYEFRAIDRPLTDKQIGSLSRYSSRADITATSFSVEEIKVKHPATVSSAPRRTTGQITARANAIMKDRQRIKREAAERERIKHEQEQAEQRRSHLESLRGKETTLLERSQSIHSHETAQELRRGDFDSPGPS